MRIKIPSNYWTLEKCKEDALRYETRTEWSKKGKTAYSIACKNNWLDECCVHMTEGCKPMGYWTLERCKEDALKHGRKVDWKNSSRGAYAAASKNNWLDECCSHMILRQNWTLEKCKEDALKYTTKVEWRSNSNGYAMAKRYKWLDECCTHMVKSKKEPKWTLEKCKEDALKYETRTEWQTKSNKTYNAAHKNKWLDECCAHMNAVHKPSGYWTLERCKEDALKYETRTEWRKKSYNGACGAAAKNNWLDECCAHMTEMQKPSGYWTLEMCKEDALKYETRTEWNDKSCGAYTKSKRSGWSDECCAHMTEMQKPSGYWTLEMCKEDALKFNTKVEWSQKSPSAYVVAHRNNWLDECCAHMKVLLWTKNNLITYLEQMKEYLHICSIPQLMTIIESNGLYRYLTKEKIKKIQDTCPDSKERIETTESLIKEIINIKEEELIEVDDINVDLSEDETGEYINDVPDNEETENEDKTELIEKTLRALDNNAITASLDDERVQFIVRDTINSMWYDVLNDKLNTNRIESLNFETEIPEKIKTDFIAEYNAVMNMEMPQGWTYSYEPLLMQKLISYRLSQHKRYGNWSGVGAGKTIGGILAGRYVGAKNTLIITFNSTIGKEDERGWTKEIRDSFRDSRIYTKIHKNIKFDDRYHNYLVLNYETFQQNGSANYVIDLLDRNKFDYIILDEVQSVKQRTKNDESKRREVVFGLVGKVRELNPNYYLLAMSATPVINNLVEAKSLIELIDFTTLEDVDTTPNISNCIELFRRLTNCGIRHKNIEDNILKGNKYTLINVDNSEHYEEACMLSYDDVLTKEQLVLDTKLEAVRPYINTSKGKTVIYTHYVGGIEDRIYEYLVNLGLKVGMYTGSSSKYNRDSTLTEFIRGDYDILIGSRPMATGVNGLQFVADRLIILSLPWTNAELEQLVGRLNRKGSIFRETGVDVIIPLVKMDGNKKIIRWDEHKYNTVTYKATIANAVVDGIIPDKILAPKEMLLEKAEENLTEWIERLERGEILTVNREELKVELYPDISDEEERRRRINSELSEFNRIGKTTKSSTMNKKFVEDPESWYRYHTLRRESMKDWEEIPYEEIAKQITCETDKVIDFGCGDNQFKDCIKNQVTSVDHIACDDTVIACDMADLSQYIESESHDVAVFSLSLWGTNYSDYLKEAHRILVRKGMIYIAEPSKEYIEEGKQNELISLLNSIGFKLVGRIDTRNKFTYITGIKI